MRLLTFRLNYDHMKRHLQKIIGWQVSALLLFTANTALAQSEAAQKVFPDSLDRYGAVGLRPGVFQCLSEENQFGLPILGPFIDYSFGKYRHSIEIDFLTTRPLKFFKNAYSPCLTYHFAVKKQLPNHMELFLGAFVNCRKDFVNRRQYFTPHDTSDFKRGFHTIFSLGPSVEVSRRLFLRNKTSFFAVGARIAYSFDILGYGSTYNTAYGMPVDYWQKIPPQERFLRDALMFTLRLGWGKLVKSNVPKMPDEVEGQ